MSPAGRGRPSRSGSPYRFRERGVRTTTKGRERGSPEGGMSGKTGRMRIYNKKKGSERGKRRGGKEKRAKEEKGGEV